MSIVKLFLNCMHFWINCLFVNVVFICIYETEKSRNTHSHSLQVTPCETSFDILMPSYYVLSNLCFTPINFPYHFHSSVRLWVLALGCVHPRSLAMAGLQVPTNADSKNILFARKCKFARRGSTYSMLVSCWLAHQKTTTKKKNDEKKIRKTLRKKKEKKAGRL